jgi:hypothetical protein
MKSSGKFCAVFLTIKVPLIVDSILFFINHGYALVQGHMSSDRWLSA